MNPDKIRNVLNILFMVLALAAIIIYFAAVVADGTGSQLPEFSDFLYLHPFFK